MEPIPPSLERSYRPGDEPLEPILREYRGCEALVKRLSSRLRVLNNVILMASVTTTGSLWLLISDVFPTSAAWVGAVLSTIVSGLSLHLKTSGLAPKLREALKTYGEIGQFIASVRGGDIPVGSAAFWQKIKEFENALTGVRYAQHG